jgi:hypothetical protein
MPGSSAGGWAGSRTPDRVAYGAAGFIPIVGVTYTIHDNYQSAITSSKGVPPAQIFIDAIGRHGGEPLLSIAIVAQSYCGMASVTANSRMIYAFSRDGAVPGSSFWHRINPRTTTPTSSIWFRSGLRLHSGGALHLEPDGTCRGHPDSHDRPLRRVHHPDFPAAQEG